jgi:hypothetical protein
MDGFRRMGWFGEGDLAISHGTEWGRAYAGSTGGMADHLPVSALHGTAGRYIAGDSAASVAWMERSGIQGLNGRIPIFPVMRVP